MGVAEKVIALAMHPSTPEAEWQAAAIAFFRIHRQKGTMPFAAAPQPPPRTVFDWSRYAQAAAAASYRPKAASSKRGPKKKKEPPKPNDNPEMPFGKYKGKTVSWIMENDSGYASWVLRTIADLRKELKDAFEAGFRKKAEQEQKKS